MANYANVGNMGPPGSDLTTISVAGESWTVHRKAAPSFKGFLTDLAATGYDLKSSGGFNDRNIRGGSIKSQHAFGNAIDVNAATNPLGSRKTDLPANVGELADKWGLEWGGTWKNRPDPMHFEWTGRGADGVAPADPSLAQPSQGTPGGSGSAGAGGDLNSRGVPQAIDTQTAVESATATGIAQAKADQKAGIAANAGLFLGDLFGRTALIGMGLIVLAGGGYYLYRQSA